MITILFIGFVLTLNRQQVPTINMADNITSVDAESILKAFQELDKNRDGFLSREEIMQHFLQVTNADEEIAKEHLHKFMEQYDVNKDGHINYVEFLQGTLTHNNANVTPPASPIRKTEQK